jgi:histone-lysine N-methyltransferase SETMAR
MSTSTHPPEKPSFSQEQFRTYALFRYLLNKETSEIHADLVAVSGPSAPSLRTVQRWVERFRGGCHDVEDLPRAGRPSTAVTTDNATLVEKLVVEDPHATVEELAEATGLSAGSIHMILHEQLRMHKISSRWVPHALNNAQRGERVELAQSLLNKMHRWGGSGLKTIVTGDESYLHYHNPGSRIERMAWTRKGEPPKTDVRPDSMREKVLYTFFFTVDGLLAKIVSPAGSTITAQFYAEVSLPQMLKAYRKIHPQEALRLHHDNAPAHRSKKVLEFIQHNEIQSIRHPPYSPDLAPADFWLLPKIKAHLRQKTFTDRNGLGQAVSQVIKSITNDEWSHAFQQWQTRLRKCVEVEGQYFEHLLQ